MKPTILVITSTFPRWKNDTLPPFVFELSKGLNEYFDVTVLAPHFRKAKHSEVMGGLKIHRFQYLPSQWEKLAGEGGIMPNLHNNPVLYLTVPFFFISEIIATLRLAKQLKPKIIHAHWIIPQGITAVIVKNILKIPYVITVHGGDIYGLKNPLFMQMKKTILQQAKNITVVSTDIKREVIKIDPGLASKTEIIPMGVDSKLFHPSKYDENIKKKYTITGPFLLFVGRLVEKKGVAYLLNAMPAILKVRPKTKLMIIGAGPEKDNLVHLATKLNIKENVIFVGSLPHSELPKYYATADIFIGPSIQIKGGDTEGFGLTFVEAGLSGCIMVGTNLGGISDIIQNNKNGLLIKSLTPKAISENIIKLIKEPNRFNKEAIRKELIKKFDFLQTTDLYRKIYL